MRFENLFLPYSKIFYAKIFFDFIKFTIRKILQRD
ncbi:hypothetical protein HPMG_00811 [Helicobacter pullorum MIT 98-5489]|uniref:Uncharacterized protein n=1 Tax=Helicobacter pullorum MIT 98-5489 TaxID=537972 RepID=C5EYK6_9HELI|nr:hypothetical protein HPMG_00811 [Helicobacter pullorum MIT 98-5489]